MTAGMAGQGRAVTQASVKREGLQPRATGMLTDAAQMTNSLADRSEEMAQEMHRAVNGLLGSEPPVDPSAGRETEPDMEPCLFGSLVSSNRRIRASLDSMAASTERLLVAYSV